ncbi:hypothetical protein [Porphyromonas sp.]
MESLTLVVLVAGSECE